MSLVPMILAGFYAVPMILAGDSTAVTTVLTAITTYVTSLVGEVTTWVSTLIPAIMPIFGIAVSVFFAIRIVKRLAKG